MSDIDIDEADEATLKRELLKMDVRLRYKQLWWEHPRNAAVVLGVIVALVAAVSGVLGFKIGSTPQQIVATVHLDQPLVKGQ